MLDRELKQGQGGMRFRIDPIYDLNLPGIYPNHWLGPYYLEKFGKHGLWVYRGPMPKAEMVPDSFIAEQPTVLPMLVWYPVLHNYVLGCEWGQVHLAWTIMDWERERGLREGQEHMDFRALATKNAEIEITRGNYGSGFQGIWDQPRLDQPPWA
jgi:hypothetical protein